MTSSELTGVNFPSFPVTSFKLMVSPTPVAAVPVGSSTALTSSHAIPVQNPSSAIVNLTLQHLGLIPPGVQVSASPGPGTVPVSPRIEAVSVAPDSTGTQQGRATRYDSPVPGHNQPNGQSVAVTGAQQVRVFPFNSCFSLGHQVQVSLSGELTSAFLLGKGWKSEEVEGLPSSQTQEEGPRSPYCRVIVGFFSRLNKNN